MFFKFPAEVGGDLLFQMTGAAQPVCSAKNTSGAVVGGNRLAVAADAKLPHAVDVCTSTVAAVFVERGRSQRHG